MKLAKGAIFMPGCQVKLEEAEKRLSLRTSGGKYYYLSHEADKYEDEPEEDTIAKLKSWAKALEYAMDSARGIKDQKVAEGNWMSKRGGKSHGYVNWKKRRFMLKGNLLLYYSDDPELFDVFKHLKGFIDLAAITSIEARENPADGIGKSFYFKLVIDNEREYFIAAQSLEQKNAWIKAIRKQTKMLADRLGYSNLRSIQKVEKVQVSGDLMRLHKHGHIFLKSYVVLTNLKLRYYESESDCDVQSFGSRMVGSIPLLGCGTQLEDDNTTISLHDLQGHVFTFEAKDSNDASNWMLAIRTASRLLITSILSKDISISLNTYAFGKKGEDMGYTIAKLDAKALTIIFLLLEKEKRLEWDEIDKVALKDKKFTLNYTRRRTGVSKVIEFKSDNAIAFFDTISVVMTTRQEIEEKERKRRAKGLSGNVDPAKALRRSNSSQAMPISPKMVQLRSSGSGNSVTPSSTSDAISPADDPTIGDLKAISSPGIKKSLSAGVKRSKEPKSPISSPSSPSKRGSNDSIQHESSLSPKGSRVKVKTVTTDSPKSPSPSRERVKSKQNVIEEAEEVDGSDEKDEKVEKVETAQKKAKKSTPPSGSAEPSSSQPSTPKRSKKRESADLQTEANTTKLESEKSDSPSKSISEDSKSAETSKTKSSTKASKKTKDREVGEGIRNSVDSETAEPVKKRHSKSSEENTNVESPSTRRKPKHKAENAS